MSDGLWILITGLGSLVGAAAAYGIAALLWSNPEISSVVAVGGAFAGAFVSAAAAGELG